MVGRAGMWAGKAYRALDLQHLKGKNRMWCLGRDMDHQANSSAELRHGGKDWYVGWQGI